MKQHDVSNSGRIEAELRKLRDELAGVESVRAQVVARIAEPPDGPAMGGGAAGEIAIATICIMIGLATVVLLNRPHPPSPTPVVVRHPGGIPASAAAPFKLDIGDAEV